MGAKVVGGIIAATTAVAVPSAIIISSNSTPETPQANIVHQEKKQEEKPTDKVETAEPKNDIPAEAPVPAKAEPIAVATPVPTREELLAQSIAEFKVTVFGDNMTGKDFLDKLREAYVRTPHPSSLEKVYPQWYTNGCFITFAKILKRYGIVEEETAHIGYEYLSKVIIDGNY